MIKRYVLATFFKNTGAAMLLCHFLALDRQSSLGRAMFKDLILRKRVVLCMTRSREVDRRLLLFRLSDSNMV